MINIIQKEVKATKQSDSQGAAHADVQANKIHPKKGVTAIHGPVEIRGHRRSPHLVIDAQKPDELSSASECNRIF